LGSNFYFPVADTDTTANYKVSIDTIKNHIKTQLEAGDDYLSFKNINSITGNKLIITVKDSNNNRYIAESNITISELDIYKNLNDKLKTAISEISKTQKEILSFNGYKDSLNKTYKDLQEGLSLCVKTSDLDKSALKNFYNKTATKNCIAKFDEGGYLVESEISIDSLQSTDDLLTKYNDLLAKFNKLVEEHKDLKKFCDGLKNNLAKS
jgi:hypothetical protein